MTSHRVLDTAHVVVCIYMMYWYLVANYGEPNQLLIVHWTFEVSFGWSLLGRVARLTNHGYQAMIMLNVSPLARHVDLGCHLLSF